MSPRTCFCFVDDLPSLRSMRANPHIRHNTIIQIFPLRKPQHCWTWNFWMKSVDPGDITRKKFRPCSSFLPALNDHPQIKIFYDLVTADIKRLEEKQLQRPNLSKEQWQALQSLQMRRDLIIKEADKGVNIVILPIKQQGLLLRFDWGPYIHLEEETRQHPGERTHRTSRQTFLLAALSFQGSAASQKNAVFFLTTSWNHMWYASIRISETHYIFFKSWRT